MWWYNRVFMPLAVRFQRPLTFVDGLIDDEQVDEVLVICRAPQFVHQATNSLKPM